MFAKQRVSGFVVRILYRMFQLLGYKAVYFSLYPVVAYYFLFAKDVKKALKIFYENIEEPFNNRIYFRHLFLYAVTMSDRFISKTHPHLYRFENFQRGLNTTVMKQGAIIASTHFGGWAAATNHFSYDDIKVHAVMNESMLQQTQNFYKSLDKNNEELVEIIDISKGMQGSLQIANALLHNECVAMMADRAYRQRDLIAHTFFKKEAYFNKSPFSIAYKADKPVVAYLFALQEPNRYETFSRIITLDKELGEEEAVRKALGEYVSFLKYYIKRYPNQWFNFYDFWRQDGISYQ
ncbi:MAG: lysophospholipid acyltransferase family protein [Campylobacterota bacterium]